MEKDVAAASREFSIAFNLAATVPCFGPDQPRDSNPGSRRRPPKADATPSAPCFSVHQFGQTGKIQELTVKLNPRAANPRDCNAALRLAQTYLQLNQTDRAAPLLDQS